MPECTADLAGDPVPKGGAVPRVRVHVRLFLCECLVRTRPDACTRWSRNSPCVSGQCTCAVWSMSDCQNHPTVGCGCVPLSAQVLLRSLLLERRKSRPRHIRTPILTVRIST